MNFEEFLDEYFQQLHRAVDTPGVFDSIIALRNCMEDVREKNGKVLLAGNGASASMASHFALDFTKQGKVRSMCFNDASFLTAYSNDYGFDNWLARAVEHHGDQGDLAIFISSSGKSANVVNGAKEARSKGMTVATFTGFLPDNPLKGLGDINFWLDSRAYNIIESAHAFWLAAVCDLLIGKSEYSVS